MNWLTEELNKSKISRKEVAAALGIARQNLWALEKGKYKMTLIQFRTIIKLLKLKPKRINEIINI